MRGGLCCAIIIVVGLRAEGQGDHVEVQKILASDGGTSQYFGVSVSTNGQFAIMGARGDTGRAPGAGAAYIHRFNGASWKESQKLVASDGAAWDNFGNAVAMDGNVALIGSFRDDDFGSASGSAYVFRFNGSAWVQDQKLLPSDGAPDDLFGATVARSGDLAVVGAIGDDDAGADAGSVYVFRLDGDEWVQEQKLTASDSGPGDRFGSALAVRGDRIIVGADSDDDQGANSGSAYAFRFDGQNWIEEQKLTPSDGTASDRFGCSASIDGDMVLIGAFGHSANTGAAYAFDWNGSAWVERQRLTASEGAPDDRFGLQVALHGDRCVVTAIWDSHGGPFTGSMYAFQWDDTSWAETGRYFASDGATNDQLGSSAAIRGDVAFIGTEFTDDLGGHSGSIYVFDLDEPASFGCPLADLTVNRGTLTRGNLASLGESDDDRVRVVSVPGATFEVAETTIKAFSPLLAPSQLDLKLETRASADVVQTRVFLRDIFNDTWTPIDAFAQPQIDTVRLYADIPNPRNYVRPTDGLIRVRVQMIRALSRGPFAMLQDEVDVTVYE